MLAPTEQIVAVVQLGTQPPGVLQQVTLRPHKVKGTIIRLGETPGDEANCWIPLALVDIIVVLGRAVEKEGKWTCDALPTPTA